MIFGGPFQPNPIYSILFYEPPWYAVEASVRNEITTQQFLLSLSDHVYFIHGYLKLFADMLHE